MILLKTLTLFALACVSAGCATIFHSEYYLFSGKIVDVDTKQGIPRAAMYIAESPEDFFKPPRMYKDNVPSYNADASRSFFDREGANRFLFLKADDDGAFTTVWRRDVIDTRFLLWPFGRNGLRSISFCAAARGYSDAVISLGATSDGGLFAESGSVVGMKENRLSPIVLEKGVRRAMTPAPIRSAYLKTRYPPAPGGKAGELFAQAEAAFHKREYTEALRLHDEALKLAPDDPMILLVRLDALFWMLRFKDVVSDGARYMALYPHVGFAQTIIADAAFRLLDPETDRKCLIRAMQLEPEFKGSYKKLCLLDKRFAEVPEGWLPPEKIWE